MTTKILFLFLVQLALFAEDYSKTLTHLYQQNEFKIYYALNGKNALPSNNQLDTNHNSVPDYVEDIANQLCQASTLLTSDLKFTHPLKQPRFKNSADCIEIFLLPLKVNGAAGDIVDKKNKALVMRLSNNLVPHTLTPLHEFFHLIQYGYTMFNNRWFMEGQARWVEYAFKKGVGKSEKLPSSMSELETLLNSIYEASSFWNRLAYLSNSEHATFQPSKLYKRVDNSFFIEDFTLYGYSFMKKVLENYQSYDKRVSQIYQYAQYNWTEKQQKSSNNNLYLLLALQKTLIDLNIKNDEIIDFITLVENYKNIIEKQNSKNDVTQKIEFLDVKQRDSIDFNQCSNQDILLNNSKITIKIINNEYFIEEKNINGNQSNSTKVKQSFLFPSKSIYYNKKKSLFKTCSSKNIGFYIGAYVDAKSAYTPFGVYKIMQESNKITISEIVLNDNYKPYAMIIHENNLYILVEDNYHDAKKIKVLRSSLDDLKTFQKVLQFSYNAQVKSFQLADGKFYFLFDEKSKEKIIYIKKD